MTTISTKNRSIPATNDTPMTLLGAALPILPGYTRRSAMIERLREQNPEVLVLSGSVGMGHVRAAENLTNALLRDLTDHSSAHLDVVQLMSRPVQKVYADGYLSLTSHLPTMLGVAYRMTDLPMSNSKAAITFDRFLARRLEKLLIQINPPVIVCTHFLASRVVGHLKAQGMIQSKLLQVVTDFDLHQFWHVPQTDHYFVGGYPAHHRLIALGTSPERITRTGIPIGLSFETLPSRDAARQQLGLPENRPTILVTLGGAGRAPFAAVLASLRRLTTPCSIVFVCGRNEVARQELTQELENFPIHPELTVRVEGFTKQMHTFMAASEVIVGKPGGLTMSEALAAGCVPMLINPIPGQEEHNADYLLEAGAALRCRHLDQLHLCIERLLQSPDELAARSLAAQALGNPQAARTIAAHIGTLIEDGNQPPSGN